MEEVQKHLYVLILAGGGGTRLWPESRENTPKQFIKFFAGKSLFDLTLSRAKKLTSPSHIFVTTSAKYASLVKKNSHGIPAENIIGEPIRRDTAMGMGIGALYIEHSDPEAVIINMASDHLIQPIDVFVRRMLLAAQTAYETNQVVTVGIVPKYPHTGMGHIKARKPFLGKSKNVLVGEKFVEKPALPLAQKYTQSGQYFWNANLYVYKAKLLLSLLQKYSPKTVAMYPKIAEAIGTELENQALSLAFQMAPSISIDYAISEKLGKFICIPGNFSWTDVGDWAEIWKNLTKDDLGNVIEGPAGKGQYIGVNSENNLFFLGKKLVATVGLSNMVVVDTPDALLICPKDDAQGVKKIVEILKEQKLTGYL